MAVKVPAEVLRDLTTVRNTGLLNMLDITGVLNYLLETHRDDTAAWVHRNRSTYVEGIITGFEEE